MICQKFLERQAKIKSLHNLFTLHNSYCLMFFYSALYDDGGDDFYYIKQ